MFRVKRLLCVVLTAALLLGCTLAVALADGEDSSEPQATAEEKKEEKKYGLSVESNFRWSR